VEDKLMTDSIGGPILITGATGTHGGAVLRALVRHGHDVIALVRDPDGARARALGVDLRPGDMTDPDSLQAAFDDAGAVYAVTTPFGDGADAEVEQGRGVIAAAAAASVPWLILASVASAGRAAVPHFESKAKIEAHLADSALDWTVVAPSYFYENIGTPDDKLALPLPPDTPLHQVALDNVGDVVAAILARRDEHLGQRVEIAGDDPTPKAMAEALSVPFEQQPIDEVEERSPDLAAMYRFLADTGYGIDVEAVRASYPEVPWVPFAEWAARVG
jgi:uncharacterized protein YbjT (DUF2867 family)